MARLRSVFFVAVLGALGLASPALAGPATGKAPGGAVVPSTTPVKDPATAPATRSSPAVEPATTPETPVPEVADPAPEVPADTPVTAGPDAGAVSALQQEARALRDELFKARGRVSLVAAKLFTTRISLQLRSNLERFYTVSNLTLRIDGAPVYVQEQGMPSTDENLFEVFAAPGSHELSVSVDLVARRDATYKIRLDHSISIAVASNERVSTRLLLRETGNMWRFAERKRGRSDLRTRLRAQAKSTDKGRAKAKAGTGGVRTGGAK